MSEYTSTRRIEASYPYPGKTFDNAGRPDPQDTVSRVPRCWY
ncbi:hypothetical protein SAMN04489812_2720 [Microlunatus soli]|uniref:Uncharacterized protein n=1 Tax=Microlunatus soli TaxID=630515 RepID=A0A1H1UBU9_9ACTN|nr:hypothetical protein SAMN04489812_2720 [Microlunatus soli]